MIRVATMAGTGMACVAVFTAGVASAQVPPSPAWFAGPLTEFDFQGNAGFGLLPDNEVGNNTSLGSGSTATGGEIGDGIVYNSDAMQLFIPFSFEGLSGGLFTTAASGIHLHVGADPANADPFDQTGGIVFNLNNFDVAAAVLNGNNPILDGATSGTVSALIDVSPELEQALFAGELYLNIHSADFTGGELRANLVPIPEPGSVALLAMAGGMVLQRLRKPRP